MPGFPDDGQNSLKRRELFKLAAGAAAVTSLPAAAAHAAGFQESPALAALVKQGKLPAVADRLPKNPEVVKPVSAVGRYGGAMRSAIRGDADHNAILRVVGNMGLTRWTPDFQKAIPNVAQSWTVSDNASVYTFKLYEGMKWSDGTPFTADDIIFFTDDLLPNTEFYAAPPQQYVINGKLMRGEKVDDTTVRLIFAGPYLNFPERLAGPLGQHPVLYAKHYCKQFMPKYNPDVPKILAQTRQPDWATLFRQHCGDIETPARWANPDRPVLDPWVTKVPYTGGATQVVLERNPYFWQVDSAGNQLPYMDALSLKVISDVQSIVLSSVGGQMDLEVRHVALINNKPVLAQHMKSGQYGLVQLDTTDVSAAALFVNQTEKNPKLRPLLTNHDFRAALSYGMDRDEINDIVFLGQSTPWQTSPLKEDRFYNEQLATQFLQHDPDKANAMLDKLGLTKRDSNGFRLLADGSRLFLTCDADVENPQLVDALQLIKQHWTKIGVDLGISPMERSLFYERAQNNDYDMGIMGLPGGLHPYTDPRAWLSVQPLDSRESLPWVHWYTSGGKAGEKPSPSMLERLQLWDQWKQAADQQTADALLKKILQLAADAYEVIGIAQGVTVFGVCSNKLKNVPATMPMGWEYPTPAPTLPQQYFFTS
jgi:peptide/nickel transport system substrate-binding protein